MPKAKSPSRPAKAANARVRSRSHDPAADTYEPWALLVIAQEPIRQTAADTYRKANARLMELRGIIERFSTVDRPAFGGWVAAAFGPLLTALREVEARINEKGPMLKTIRMMTFLSGCSPREAYDEVIRGKAADERRAARQAAGEKPEEDEEDDLDEEDLFEGMPEELKRMFGFGTSKASETRRESVPPKDGTDPDTPPPRSERGRGRARPTREPTPEQQTSAQRLKTAYRAVVRRLHPDLRAETSAYDQQLWHEAQNAYARGDLERLETILAVSELAGDGSLPSGTGLSGLLTLTRQLEASVRQLERQVRASKKDLAWNFSAPVSREKLRQKVGARLRQEVAEARAELVVIEGELAFCRDAPLPQRRGGARGKKSHPPSRKPKKR